MLHIGSEQQKVASSVEIKEDKDVNEIPVSAPSTSSINAHTSTLTEHVFLATAIVSAANVNGNMIPCRSLLHSGSQISFITEELAQTLKLKKVRIEHAINGIGETSQRVTSAVW